MNVKSSLWIHGIIEPLSYIFKVEKILTYINKYLTANINLNQKVQTPVIWARPLLPLKFVLLQDCINFPRFDNLTRSTECIYVSRSITHSHAPLSVHSAPQQLNSDRGAHANNGDAHCLFKRSGWKWTDEAVLFKVQRSIQFHSDVLLVHADYLCIRKVYAIT